MPDENTERPLAHPGYEKTAAELFPYTVLSPEEYAGREGANWGCFSFSDYRFQNAALDGWIQALGKILFTPGLTAQYQAQYLTAEEITEQKRLSEEFKIGTMC